MNLEYCGSFCHHLRTILNCVPDDVRLRNVQLCGQEQVKSIIVNVRLFFKALTSDMFKAENRISYHCDSAGTITY